MLIIPRGNHGNQRKANRHWRSLGVGRTRKRMHVSLWAESFQLARDSLAQSPWPPESRSCVISYSSGRNVEARPGHRTRPRAPTHLVLEHDSVLSFSHLVTFPVTFPSIIKRSMKKVIHCDVQPLFLPIPLQYPPILVPVLSGSKYLGKVERADLAHQDFSHTLSWASSWRDLVNNSPVEFISSKHNMSWKGGDPGHC